MTTLSKIGDRSTSDVVVRLRTSEGRDDWFYSHSRVLIEKCKYFADRLSEKWPTCQIIDSRNCVELTCQESEIDHIVNFLRFLHVDLDGSSDDIWHGVKNTLGILLAAVELGSPQIVIACARYLEAVPWEESDEDEILKTIPGVGPEAEHILDRLQPCNTSAIKRIFLAAFKIASSAHSSSMKVIRTSAKDQLEYLLAEDEDSPILTPDDQMKSIVKEGAKGLFTRFNSLLTTYECEHGESVPKVDNLQKFIYYLSDLAWVSQVMVKFEIMFEFVNSWVDASGKVLQVVQIESSTTEVIKAKLMALEVTADVLDAIGFGAVILPTEKRLYMVKVWLPFVRATKYLTDSLTTTDENSMATNENSTEPENENSKELKNETDLKQLWQSLQAAFVSLVLTLPSGNLAEILTEWLQNKHIHYPDFTEAFETWCYRCKVANRRLRLIAKLN